MPVISYDKTKSLQGILWHFYDKNNDLFQEIEAYATSMHFDYLNYRNAFDFNLSTYWLGSYYQTGDISISFCLKHYYARIAGFELATNPGGIAKPQEFAFSTSIDNSTYSHQVPYYQSYQTSYSFYFKYNSPITKCFKLTCIKAMTNKIPFDVSQIEIYGEYKSIQYKESIHPTLGTSFFIFHD